MGTKLRIALLGAWHVHARDYAGDCDRNPDTTLVAVWDDDVERGATFAETWGVPFQPDREAILNDPSIDGVIVTTATVQHLDVMTAAAQAGKHIYTEKVIAPTNKEAEQIARAARDAGIVMTVSLPRLYAGYVKAIDEVVGGGELGDVRYVRVRVSHDGAVRRNGNAQWLPEHFFDRSEAAGGAMIDFGAHPYYLVHHFAGEPQTITAHFLSASGHDVDDQAIVICGYPGAKQGVAEASFLSRTAGYQIELHGEDGSIRYDDGEGLRMRTIADPEWRAVDVPADDPTPFDRWVQHIHDNQQDEENLAAGLSLTRLAAAAERSAREGRTVDLS